jgi:predicted RNA-binding protein associated with RNAse of E/G family
MKRKYIDHSKWERIEKNKSILFNTYQERFNGYASAIFIEKVHEKLVCNFDKRQVCVLDDGYILIQRLPIEKNWSVTTIFDENNNIIDWYFDITKQNDIDIHSQPFYDDLYLDVVVFPSGEIVLLDEDELNKALENGDITQMDFDLAYNVANQIINGMAKDVLSLSNMSYDDLEFFSEQLSTNYD